MDPRRELTLRHGYDGLGDLDATLDPLTRERLAVLLDALTVPDPARHPRHGPAPHQRPATAPGWNCPADTARRL
ncbi:hypothetical protein BH23ACT7_BH23ACT7_15150 [soil metagenome]